MKYLSIYLAANFCFACSAVSSFNTIKKEKSEDMGSEYSISYADYPNSLSVFEGVGNWVYEDLELKDQPNAVLSFNHTINFGEPDEFDKGNFRKIELDFAEITGFYQIVKQVVDVSNVDGSLYSVWEVDLIEDQNVYLGLVCIQIDDYVSEKKYMNISIGDGVRPKFCDGVTYSFKK